MEFIDLKTQQLKIKSELDRRIQTVLTHGQYIMGPEVKELEDKLAKFCGASECITVSSGTEALLISLMALGIGPGDEVITSPFTFVATAEVICLVGATPVFIDIDPANYNMDPSLLEAAITKKTKAIMPVSMYGQPSDMDAINSIAQRHGLPVIEDAAQSFGAKYKGKFSCNLSEIGCTSFFPSKPLGCYGDGGAIFTSNAALAKIMREIRVHGQERRYHHTRIGVGGRMDTLQCAIVLTKFSIFAEEIALRESIAGLYLRALKDSRAVEIRTGTTNCKSVWAQFTVEVNNRAEVVELLAKNGVPTAIHYPTPLHMQPGYRNICKVIGSLKHSELASGVVMSLPMHPYLKESDVNYICDFLR